MLKYQPAAATRSLALLVIWQAISISKWRKVALSVQLALLSILDHKLWIVLALSQHGNICFSWLIAWSLMAMLCLALI